MNTHFPLVSIVIPVFNAGLYLRESIQSALDQSYKSVEVIVVDDGSEDAETLDIIRGYSDLKIARIRNSGACVARNVGVSIAKGTFIQFLDADDILYRDAVERKVGLLSGHAEITCLQTQYFGDDSCTVPTRISKAGRFSFSDLLKVQTPQTSSPLYPRVLLDQCNGFDAKLPRAHEYDLNLRIALKHGCTFHVHSGLSTKIRAVQGSISRSVGANYDLSMSYVLRKILEDSTALNKLSSEDLRGVLCKLVYFSRFLLRNGNVQDAMLNLKCVEDFGVGIDCFSDAYDSCIKRLIVRSIGVVAYEKVLYLWTRMKMSVPTRNGGC